MYKDSDGGSVLKPNLGFDFLKNFEKSSKIAAKHLLIQNFQKKSCEWRYLVRISKPKNGYNPNPSLNPSVMIPPTSSRPHHHQMDNVFDTFSHAKDNQDDQK